MVPSNKIISANLKNPDVISLLLSYKKVYFQGLFLLLDGTAKAGKEKTKK